MGLGRRERRAASEMAHPLKALAATSDLHSIPRFHMVERDSYNLSSDLPSPDTHTSPCK